MKYLPTSILSFFFFFLFFIPFLVFEILSKDFRLKYTLESFFFKCQKKKSSSTGAFHNEKKNSLMEKYFLDHSLCILEILSGFILIFGRVSLSINR